MKRIFIFLVLVFQISLFAKGSMTCPRILKLKLKDLQQLSHNSEERQSLGYRGILRVTMRLSQITAGRCYYEGRNNKGEYFWGHIKESTGEYTASPLVLILKSEQHLIPVGIDSLSPIHSKEGFVEILSQQSNSPIARAHTVQFQ